jgi:hypothetical protein
MKKVSVIPRRGALPLASLLFATGCVLPPDREGLLEEDASSQDVGRVGTDSATDSATEVRADVAVARDANATDATGLLDAAESRDAISRADAVSLDAVADTSVVPRDGEASSDIHLSDAVSSADAGAPDAVAPLDAVASHDVAYFADVNPPDAAQQGDVSVHDAAMAIDVDVPDAPVPLCEAVGCLTASHVDLQLLNEIVEIQGLLPACGPVLNDGGTDVIVRVDEANFAAPASSWRRVSADRSEVCSGQGCLGNESAFRAVATLRHWEFPPATDLVINGRVVRSAEVGDDVMSVVSSMLSASTLAARINDSSCLTGVAARIQPV